MATSPNFSWPEPDNTDLVKNGALAIRTAVDAIDSSMADLKGGTTGQVLSKTSNTDMDFTWVAQDDSNAIQSAIVDAKGDLIAASAADTPARLAVGADNTTLVSDSTATTGLKWVGFRGCSVYNTVSQVLANATTTTLTFNSESIDTDGFHSTSTNTGRITIPTGLGGKYLINTTARFGLAASGFKTLKLYKNGGQTVDIYEETNNAFQYQLGSKSFILELVAGDYLELGAFQSSGGNLDFYGRALELPFSVQYLGA
jgi:hypothetical protein